MLYIIRSYNDGNVVEEGIVPCQVDFKYAEKDQEKPDDQAEKEISLSVARTEDHIPAYFHW